MMTDTDFVAGGGLLLRPSIHPMESAQGWLLRAHEINGRHWHEHEFLKRRKRLGQFMAGVDLSSLHEAGIEAGAFRATTARDVSEKRVVIGGEEIHRNDWTTVLRRWCPACWRQDLDDESLKGRTRGWRIHRRFWWDAISVLTCPIHRVRLESACPTCRIDVKWQAGSLTMCRGGHSLMACTPVEVAPEHSRADSYIVGRLGGAPRIHVPVLDALPLYQAIDVIKRFGSAAIAGPRGGFRSIDRSCRPEAMSVGWSIAQGWPNKFNELLDAMTDARDQDLLWGLDQVYGELVVWARKNRNTVSGRAIHDAIHSHHAKRAPVANHTVAAVFTNDASPVSITRVAEAAGNLSPRLISRYVELMGQSIPKNASGISLVPRSIMQQLIDIFEDSIEMDEIAAMLGVEVTRVYPLVKAGILKPMPIHVQAKAHTKRFSRKDVQALLDRLAGNAPIVRSVPNRLAPFGARNTAVVGGGFATMIKAVFAGRASVKARLASPHGATTGLKALLVDPVEFRRARYEALNDGIGAKDALPSLSIHPASVAAAVDAGLLVRLPSNGKTMALARTSVEEFARTYTTTVKLCGESKALQREAFRRLNELGVKPVLSKENDARCRGAIYRITDIPDELMVKLKKDPSNA